MNIDGKITISPVTRIEGHLKIDVDIEGGKVVDAKSTGTMFRGFEIILKGRDPRDACQIAAEDLWGLPHCPWNRMQFDVLTAPLG